jgi:hypothetical protein
MDAQRKIDSLVGQDLEPAVKAELVKQVMVTGASGSGIRGTKRRFDQPFRRGGGQRPAAVAAIPAPVASPMFAQPLSQPSAQQFYPFFAQPQPVFHQRQPPFKMQKLSCFGCGQPGHTRAICPDATK